jgi:hypothetical protein
MNIKYGFFLLMLSSCAAHAHVVKLMIHDEHLLPIEDAEVEVSFDNPRSPVRYDEQSSFTDDEGRVMFRGNGLLGASIRAKKESYYPFAHYPGYRFRASSKQLDKGFSAELLLRRIRNPIPLYSKKIIEATQYRPYKISVENEPVGFDFEVGDWVAPYGNGKVADILFRYEKEFVEFASIPSRTLDQVRESYKRRCKSEGIAYTEEGFREFAGKWNSEFEVSFPSEKEGIQFVEDQFNVHSVLRMPHEAPEGGYQDGFTIEKHHTDPPRIARDDIGYFLRTRVRLNEDGEIESANYAKIYGEIEFLPTGYVYFHYYFNPTRNDRNLEFDTKRNLFGEDVIGSKVNLP